LIFGGGKARGEKDERALKSARKKKKDDASRTCYGEKRGLNQQRGPALIRVRKRRMGGGARSLLFWKKKREDEGKGGAFSRGGGGGTVRKLLKG